MAHRRGARRTLLGRSAAGIPGNPPSGFIFLIDGDGAYLVDGDGAYLLEAI